MNLPLKASRLGLLLLERMLSSTFDLEALLWGGAV